MNFPYIYCKRIERELKELGENLIYLSLLNADKGDEKAGDYQEGTVFTQRLKDKVGTYLRNILQAIHSRRSLINRVLIPANLMVLPFSRRKLKEMQIFVYQHQDYPVTRGTQNAMD
jgi:hypothetical protein